MLHDHLENRLRIVGRLTYYAEDVRAGSLPREGGLGFIEQAISCGVERIICQKPFCLDISEAQEATQLSKEFGVPIVVHENFRFQPWYRAIKTQLVAGEIGDVLQLTFRLRPGDGQGKGGGSGIGGVFVVLLVRSSAIADYSVGVSLSRSINKLWSWSCSFFVFN